MFIKTLKWPVISLLVTGMLHFVLEAVRPDLQTFFIPPVLALILLPYGAWTGYKAIHYGGTYVLAVVAAIILGLLPLMLDTVGFGMILGRGTTWGVSAGLFGFSLIVFGALIGSGFALSRNESKM